MVIMYCLVLVLQQHHHSSYEIYCFVIKIRFIFSTHDYLVVLCILTRRRCFICRLNAVREICNRSPLALSVDLLRDLVRYKTYKDKSKYSVASIQLSLVIFIFLHLFCKSQSIGPKKVSFKNQHNPPPNMRYDTPCVLVKAIRDLRNLSRASIDLCYDSQTRMHQVALLVD